jgi:cyanophycin synthetase
VAALVVEGVRTAMDQGARCKQVETVLDEIAATRHAIARSNAGDLIVVCVDRHAAVMAELESYSRQAQPGARAGGGSRTSVSDPDFSPTAAGPA